MKNKKKKKNSLSGQKVFLLAALVFLGTMLLSLVLGGLVKFGSLETRMVGFSSMGFVPSNGSSNSTSISNATGSASNSDSGMSATQKKYSGTETSFRHMKKYACNCDPTYQSWNICGCFYSANYTVEIDKKEYCPGETITVKGKVSTTSDAMNYGSNPPASAILYGRINGTVKKILDVPWWNATTGTGYYTQTFKAESAIGSYSTSDPGSYAALFTSNIAYGSKMRPDDLNTLTCSPLARPSSVGDERRSDPAFCFPRIEYKVVNCGS